MDKEVRGCAQTAGANSRRGATKKREISRTFFSHKSSLLSKWFPSFLSKFCLHYHCARCPKQERKWREPLTGKMKYLNILLASSRDMMSVLTSSRPRNLSRGREMMRCEEGGGKKKLRKMEGVEDHSSVLRRRMRGSRKAW